MERCKCGLAWELTRQNVEVSYRGLIRCLCERPLMAWDGFFFYTVERRKRLFTSLPRWLILFLLSLLKSHEVLFLCNRWCWVVVVSL